MATKQPFCQLVFPVRWWDNRRPSLMSLIVPQAVYNLLFRLNNSSGAGNTVGLPECLQLEADELVDVDIRPVANKINKIMGVLFDPSGAVRGSGSGSRLGGGGSSSGW